MKKNRLADVFAIIVSYGFVVAVCLFMFMVWFNESDIRSEPKATIIRITSPGYSHCYRCGVTWNYVEPHVITYDKETGRGCFFVCDQCWYESDTGELIVYATKMWEMWSKFGEKDSSEFDAIISEIKRIKQ